MCVQTMLQTVLPGRTFAYQTQEKLLLNDSPGKPSGMVGRWDRLCSTGVTGWTTRQCCHTQHEDVLVSSGYAPLPTSILHRAEYFFFFERLACFYVIGCWRQLKDHRAAREPSVFFIWRHLTAHPSSQVHILILWSLAKLLSADLSFLKIRINGDGKSRLWLHPCWEGKSFIRGWTGLKGGCWSWDPTRHVGVSWENALDTGSLEPHVSLELSSWLSHAKNSLVWFPQCL